MPGFPASNSQGLKDIQNYDVATAKQLLADAGFPDGKGFPKLTLWLRNEAPVRQAVAQAIAASIKQNLGIDVDVSNKETKTFTDALNAKPTQIQFGMVSYGMDFLDPYNMLSVWLGGGRHNWNNAAVRRHGQEGRLVHRRPGRSASRCSRTPRSCWSPRSPASSSTTATSSDLYKPYLKGSELEPDQERRRRHPLARLLQLQHGGRLDVHLEGRGDRQPQAPGAVMLHGVLSARCRSAGRAAVLRLLSARRPRG